MKFRTDIEATRPINAFLDHTYSILSMGSCFAVETGVQLLSRLYNIAINPLGTLYNPLSIDKALNNALQGCIEDECIIFDSNNTWHSLNHHSQFSSTDPQLLRQRIQRANCKVQETLRESNTCVLITLGTSRVFILKENEAVVANCHKLPQSMFRIKDLSIDEIEASLRNVIEKIRTVSPEAKVILTVSPIRHLSWGLHNDKISKAKLLVATNNVVEDLNEVYYFPSYEIMIDDLRDYRFYATDMVHPSPTAVEYIFQVFNQYFIPSSELPFNKDALALYKRLQHKSNTDADNSQFTQKTLELQDRLCAQYPNIATVIKSLSNAQ